MTKYLSFQSSVHTHSALSLSLSLQELPHVLIGKDTLFGR